MVAMSAVEIFASIDKMALAILNMKTAEEKNMPKVKKIDVKGMK